MEETNIPTLSPEEAIAAARELGRTNVAGAVMGKAQTPLEQLDRIFALAAFAKHRLQNYRKGRHIIGRTLRAKARISKRKNKRS